MSEILPIDREKLTQEPEPTPSIEIKIEEPETEEKDAVETKEETKEEIKDTKEDLFDKPKIEPPVVISKRTGKPKRKMSDKQLANLAKAQEASRIKRGKVKEARELAKTAKKLEIEKRKQEKIDKKLEDDAMVEMRNKIYLEETARAKADATWDEARLSALMNKTIQNYITEKKAQKPKPKEFIPAQQVYQQYPPQHPQNQYAQPYAYQPQPPPNYATSKPIYQQKQSKNTDPMSNLFGYNPQ